MPAPSLPPTEPSTERPTTLAEAFIAGFRSPDTRSAYRRDLHCWLDFCLERDVHPYAGVRRTQVEAYLRHLEQHRPALANNTLRRRISTLSSWFTWLEDEETNVGNPAARVRRPRRHARPQPWLDRNELTDVLTAVEAEGGDGYALVCLLALNGLRISEACAADDVVPARRPAPATQVRHRPGRPRAQPPARRHRRPRRQRGDLRVRRT